MAPVAAAAVGNGEAVGPSDAHMREGHSAAVAVLVWVADGVGGCGGVAADTAHSHGRTPRTLRGCQGCYP